MSTTALPESERLAIARRIGFRSGERDGRYDATTYRGATSIRNITTHASLTRLRKLAVRWDKTTSTTKLQDLAAESVQESTYLAAYLLSWWETRETQEK